MVTQRQAASVDRSARALTVKCTVIVEIHRAARNQQRIKPFDDALGTGVLVGILVHKSQWRQIGRHRFRKRADVELGVRHRRPHRREIDAVAEIAYFVIVELTLVRDAAECIEQVKRAALCNTNVVKHLGAAAAIDADFGEITRRGG